jgi:hypothetical protein
VFNNGTQGIGLYNGDNIQAYNNVVYGNGTKGLSGVAGIRVGLTTTNASVDNNTVYGQGSNASGILILSSATGTIIRNNIVYNNPAGHIVDNGINTVLFPSNNITTTNPLFVDPANANFQLQSNSPAIDAGTTLAHVTTDIIGVGRPQGSAYDIGAYEFFQGGSPTPMITLTYPIDGIAYRWRVGQAQTITFTSSNVVGGIDFWVSQNGGVSFEKAIFNTANTGSIVWTVTPPAARSLARVKVSAANDPTVFDQSTAFTIHGEKVK